MRARLAASPLIHAASPRQRRTWSALAREGDGLGDFGFVGVVDGAAGGEGDVGAGEGGGEAGADGDRLLAAAGAGPGAEHLAGGVGEGADEGEPAGVGGRGRASPRLRRRTIERVAASRAVARVAGRSASGVFRRT